MRRRLTILSTLIGNDLLFHSFRIYSRPASERYRALLAVLEKLYVAMVELGFSPTDGE